jgi:hypothetical protein
VPNEDKGQAAPPPYAPWFWGVSYARTAADLVVSTDPTLLFGAVILTSVTGGDATIYDGRDASSGSKVITLEGIANQSTPVMFPQPVTLQSGLFVDVGSNVTEVLVLWRRSLD